jgi:hypothetical protein
MNRPVIVSDRYEQLIDPLTSQPRLDGWVDLFFRCASKPIGFLMLVCKMTGSSIKNFGINKNLIIFLI